MQGLWRLLVVRIQDLLLLKNCHKQAALGEVIDISLLFSKKTQLWLTANALSFGFALTIAVPVLIGSRTMLLPREP